MEKSVRCGFLLARLSSSQCQPTALGSAGPACLTHSLPAHRRKGALHRANRPHLKSPGTRSGMPGIFLFLFNGDHTGKALPLSTAAAAKGGKLSLYGLLPDAGGLLTDPLVSGALPQGRTAPGKPPHPKIPGTHLGMPGIFPFIAAVPGVTSARRSHGLPL